MDVAIGLVALVTTVGVFAWLADRAGLPAPLVLTAVGVVGSYLPFVPEVDLDPEIVLVGLLPPLLYAAAIRTSLVDFRRNARVIGLLSVGLVAFTTVLVGVVAWALLDVPFGVAIALGAVVAPPDAVAATAIARRTGMPRRVVSILEGESLVNDATALVLLRTALATIGGTVSVLEVGGAFLLAAGGGLVIGVAVAMVIVTIRRHVTDTVLDTSLSLVAPFGAFLAAEEIHVGGYTPSGVLAVVVTGLLLGHKAPLVQTAASRISERANWSTVQFLLEHAVFLLIGLQARTIVDQVSDSPDGLGRAVLVAAAVLGVCVVARPLWVFPAIRLARLGRRGGGVDGPMPAVPIGDAPGWACPAVVSWAGMRGVVTLAAVFAFPEDTPQREVLVFVALAVVAGTLLVQGSTLPFVTRWLGLAGPDPGEDALQLAVLYDNAAEAGRRRLEEVVGDRADDYAPDVIALLRRRSVTRANSLWERLGRDVDLPSVQLATLRAEMLVAERDEVVRARDTGDVDAEVLAVALQMLDVEESILDRVRLDSEARSDDLVARARPAALCEHLAASPAASERPEVAACSECLREGTTWVHLRMCLTCREVACCDSSVRHHATEHFRHTGHPVMRSVEPGEAWRWCYVDQRIG